MKKLLIVLLVILLVIPIYSKEKTKTVFNELELDNHIYEVTFGKGDMNTNKIIKYLNDIRILTIYPYVNQIYAKNFNNLESYSFPNKVDIDKFSEYYISELDKNGFKQEAIWAKINGIAIQKIKVYTKEEKLKSLNWNYTLIS